MRYRIHFATVAFICCGPSPLAFAQNQAIHGTPTPLVRLVAVQISEDASPLDLNDDDFNAAFTDPQSLPEDQRLDRSSPVDRIIENSSSEGARGIPIGSPAVIADGTSSAPLYWSHTSHVHNAFADYMRTQWCSDGLWDTFAAERAAQCAHQAAKIAGEHRHGCGRCGQCGCGYHAYSGHCGTCGSFGCGRPFGLGRHACGHESGDCDMQPINRYKLHRHSGCKVFGNHRHAGECESCDQTLGCDATHQANSTHPAGLSNSANSVPTSTEISSGDNPFKVAFFPMRGDR